MAFADAVATQVRRMLELDEDGQRAALAALASRGGHAKGSMSSVTDEKAATETTMSPKMAIPDAPGPAPPPGLQASGAGDRSPRWNRFQGKNHHNSASSVAHTNFAPGNQVPAKVPAKVPAPAVAMPPMENGSLHKVVEELTTSVPPAALPVLQELLTALTGQPTQGHLRSRAALPALTGEEAAVAAWLSHELQRQQQESARRLLTNMAAAVGNMAADAAALAAARHQMPPQAEAHMAQPWSRVGPQQPVRRANMGTAEDISGTGTWRKANMASTKCHSGNAPLHKAHARPGGAAAAWPGQVQGTAKQQVQQFRAPAFGVWQAPGAAAAWAKADRRTLCQADPPQDSPAETLRAHLQSLVKLDSGRIIIVRKINRLGFASPNVLTAHYSHFGTVDRVLVAHSRVKQTCQWKVELTDAQRLRPSGLGFVVMSEVSEAEAIFAQGAEQLVGGTLIRVQRFERRVTQDAEEEAQDAEEEESSETAAPDTGSEGRIANTSSSEDNNSGLEG